MLLVFPWEDEISQRTDTGFFPVINKQNIPGDFAAVFTGVSLKPVVFEYSEPETFVQEEQNSCRSRKQKGQKTRQDEKNHGKNKRKNTEAGIIKENEKTFLENLENIGIQPGPHGGKKLKGKNANYQGPENHRGKEKAGCGHRLHAKVKRNHLGNH